MLLRLLRPGLSQVLAMTDRIHISSALRLKEIAVEVVPVDNLEPVSNLLANQNLRNPHPCHFSEVDRSKTGTIAYLCNAPTLEEGQVEGR